MEYLPEKEIRVVMLQGEQFRYILDENECWNAFGYRETSGYPMMNGAGKTISISRYVYELLHGTPPGGVVVRHKCDNPRCFNPAHLVDGTHADNVRDRVERGRSARGEKHGRAKLTRSKVKKILSDTETSICDLARRFGVTPKAIRLIKQRINWKHVT